jgi:hypothetical protein
LEDVFKFDCSTKEQGTSSGEEFIEVCILLEIRSLGDRCFKKLSDLEEKSSSSKKISSLSVTNGLISLSDNEEKELLESSLENK